MKTLAVIAFGVAILTGCATQYQPVGASGGFTETKRGDIQIVQFQGNGFSKAAQVEDMALLRAAEIGKERGFTHMTILDEKASTQHSAAVLPGQSRTTGRLDGTGNFRATTQQFGGGVMQVTKPGARIAVTYTPGKIEWNPYSMSVQEIIDELSPKYRR